VPMMLVVICVLSVRREVHCSHSVRWTTARRDL
jgi:hypothetical protein